MACGDAVGDTEDTLQLEGGPGVTYTVPQRIRPAGVDKSVDVFFRVGRVYRDAHIVVESGGETVASFKREHMAPGEMERIPLPKKILDKIRNNSVEIHIEEGGEAV